MNGMPLIVGRTWPLQPLYPVTMFMGSFKNISHRVIILYGSFYYGKMLTRWCASF